MKEPTSMEECIYFTNRNINSGKVKAWVFKEKCPKCGLGLMGKPVEKGKVKIRATEYVCPECGYKEEKTEHEESLTLEAKYKCPKCSSRNYKKTFINKMDKICPYCNSGNIKKTYFPSHKKQCPKCHSDDITKPRNVPVYKLVIKRQPRFWIREV